MMNILREQELRNLERHGDVVQRLVETNLDRYIGCIKIGGLNEAERAMYYDLDDLLCQEKVKQFTVKVDQSPDKGYYRFKWVYQTSVSRDVRTLTHSISSIHVLIDQ